MTALSLAEINCTIVICAFNAEKYIAQTLDSCFDFANNLNVKVLVVDDCSTDNTYQIIKDRVNRFPQTLKLVQNDKNIGLTKSLIKATTLVETKYFARLDAEDLNYAGRIKYQVSLLENTPSAVCCSCDYVLINSIGKSVREVRLPEKKRPLKEELVRNGNPFCHSTLVFNTERFKSLGGYNSKLPYRQDLDLLIRIEDSDYFHVHLSKTLVGYRVLPDSLSSDSKAILYGFLIRNYYSEKYLPKIYSLDNYIDKYFSSRLPYLEFALSHSVKVRRRFSELLLNTDVRENISWLKQFLLFICGSFVIFIQPLLQSTLKRYVRLICK